MSVESVLSDIIKNAFNIDFNTLVGITFSTAIVVFLLVFVIRWLGNKGMGQLKTIELIILVGLGDAIGQSMLKPSETSIPQGFTVIIIAIAIFKMYDHLTTKYTKFSKVIERDPILLVKDGKIIDEAMEKAKISRKELESYLRLTGTDDISEIKTSYLEINGQVSFVKKKSKRLNLLNNQKTKIHSHNLTRCIIMLLILIDYGFFLFFQRMFKKCD